eukprot:7386906-Prymnesium_polylepis.4
MPTTALTLQRIPALRQTFCAFRASLKSRPHLARLAEALAPTAKRATSSRMQNRMPDCSATSPQSWHRTSLLLKWREYVMTAAVPLRESPVLDARTLAGGGGGSGGCEGEGISGGGGSDGTGIISTWHLGGEVTMTSCQSRHRDVSLERM